MEKALEESKRSGTIMPIAGEFLQTTTQRRHSWYHRVRSAGNCYQLIVNFQIEIYGAWIVLLKETILLGHMAVSGTTELIISREKANILTTSSPYFQIAIEIIQIHTVVIYLSFMRFVSEGIQVFINQVRNRAFRCGGGPALQVSRWEKINLILGLVHEINGFFGPLMLPIFGTIFVKVIICSYQLVSYQLVFFKPPERDIAIFLLRFIEKVIIMLALVFGTERMKSKVII